MAAITLKGAGATLTIQQLDDNFTNLNNAKAELASPQSFSGLQTFLGGIAVTGGIGNAALTNSSVTIGSTAISLGSTSTTLVGLTSLTSTALIGTLTGASNGAHNGTVGATTPSTGAFTTLTGTTFTGNVVGNVTGNVSGTALSVTGTVAIANGGTGQTAGPAALSALGGAPLASPAFTGTATFVNATFSGSASFVKPYTPTVTVGYAATLTVNTALSNVFEVGTLTGNVTTFNTGAALFGETVNIRFVQNGTGGWTVVNPVGSAVSGSINTVANKVSWLVMTFSQVASRWEGSWSSLP